VRSYSDTRHCAANPRSACHPGSADKIRRNADGSSDIHLSKAIPGGDKEANWLPSPKGAFNLTMRLYAPKPDALTGKWNPPAVTKAQTLPGVVGQ